MISHYTFSCSVLSEIEKELEKALNTITFEPTLAIGFMSVKLPITKVMRLFNTQGIDLFGSSTSGEILFTKEKDIISEGGAVFVLTDINKNYYKLNLFHRENENSFDFGKRIGEKVNSFFSDASFLVGGSGLTLDGQMFVEGIMDVAGKNVTMYGGLAGDDAKFEKTFVFTESQITENGAVVLAFDKKHVKMSGLATSGWVGLGAELKVTRSEGNIVYEIDNQPALEVYKNYLNVSEDDLPSIGLEYPLMLKKDGIENGPLRAVLNVDKENKTLIFAGSVPQGSTISFSTSTGFEIMETTRQKIIDFYEQNPRADLLILFSCVARHMALGPLISSEIKLASIKWDSPVIGYFTYGEIGNNANNVCDFYNQTFTLAAISII